MKLVAYFLCLTFLVGCCATRKTQTDTKYIETIKIDTIWEEKIIEVPVYIPADTVKIVKDSIVYVEKIVDDIKNNKFTIDTMRAETPYSKAEAGVTNNLPYLNLFDKELDSTILHKIMIDHHLVKKDT